MSAESLVLSNADQGHVFLWVALGLGLGALVGLEREYRGHEAGIRTASFVCGGAAMFTQMSTLFGDSRVAAAVVQGVGFLGAGLIFQTRRGDTKGVTTAAMVWVVAGLGVVVGMRLWLAATLIAVTLVVLLELAPLSNWVLTHGRPHASPTKPASVPDDQLG